MSKHGRERRGFKKELFDEFMRPYYDRVISENTRERLELSHVNWPAGIVETEKASKCRH